MTATPPKPNASWPSTSTAPYTTGNRSVAGDPEATSLSHQPEARGRKPITERSCGSPIFCKPSRSVVDDADELLPVACSAQRLYVADVVRAAPGQRHDVVSLQRGLGVARSQRLVSVPFAERPELLGGEAARAGMLRRSPCGRC